jgi:hypothetical protein
MNVLYKDELPMQNPYLASLCVQAVLKPTIATVQMPFCVRVTLDQ